MSAGELVADGAVRIEEATRISGLGRTTLYRLMSAGEIATVKIGARRLIPRSELRRILAENLVPAEAAK